MPNEQSITPNEAWMPIRLLTLAVALTIGAVAWFGWLVVDMTNDYQHTGEQSARIERLLGDVSQFDEVLSGSVRLAVATGDQKWAERYRRIAPRLDASINEVRALATSASTGQAVARLGEANATLAAMESHAFALVRDGRIDEARRLVFSSEYEAQERRYAQSMASAITVIGLDAREAERRDQRLDFLLLIGAIVVGAAALLTWGAIVSKVKRSHVALERALIERAGAEQALRQAHDELEARVVERTAELGEANESLYAWAVEREKTEEALRASNELFHQLANNVNDVFWVRSPDARELRYISPAYEQIWGRSTESLRTDPQQWIDFVLPEDRDRVQHEFSALGGDARKVNLEYRIVRTSGEIRWVHLRASQVRDAADRVISLIGIVTDITDRKSAEATRDRMVEILESTTDFVGFADPGGSVLYINPAGRRMIGLTPVEDITGMRIADLVPDSASSPTLTEGLPTAIRDGTWSGEMILLSRTGDRYPASQVIIGHKRPDGEVEYISTIIRDLTEVKRLEAGLFRTQKMETVGRLAGGVAHEFNSILTAIIGRSEFLLAALPAGSPLARHATEIRNASDRAATLTRRLLAYGRKQTLFPVRLDLNLTTQSMEETLRHLLGSNVDLRLILTDGLNAVRADVGQIEQVIVNLAINAGDAMPDGGKLTVETANVTFDEESAGRDPELKPGDYVMLAMTDTGTGMSADVKARAFEPFFTTKDVGSGTGLGLSTCDGIVKQSGGYISLYSELNLGTSFKVYLPRYDQPAVGLPANRESPSLPRGTEMILLVEDDPALREMAAVLLRSLGYVVLDADGGATALRLAEGCGDTAIDLLFTDVVMPSISGVELADRIRVSRPATKTLFTSAYTGNAIVHRRMLSPGDALLQKPFTPSALAIKVREVLDRQAA